MPTSLNVSFSDQDESVIRHIISSRRSIFAQDEILYARCGRRRHQIRFINGSIVFLGHPDEASFDAAKAERLFGGEQNAYQCLSVREALASLGDYEALRKARNDAPGRAYYRLDLARNIASDRAQLKKEPTWAESGHAYPYGLYAYFNNVDPGHVRLNPDKYPAGSSDKRDAARIMNAAMHAMRPVLVGEEFYCPGRPKARGSLTLLYDGARAGHNRDLQLRMEDFLALIRATSGRVAIGKYIALGLDSATGLVEAVIAPQIGKPHSARREALNPIKAELVRRPFGDLDLMEVSEGE